MIRIAGVNLPDHKRAAIGLTAIFGMGRNLSLRILQQLQISPDIRIKDLTSAEEQKIREYIENNVKVEGELRREVITNIKHHKDIGTWRGLRHSKGLPARGQRTKTNSRTVRGNVRKTAGSGRRTSAEKT